MKRLFLIVIMAVATIAASQARDYHLSLEESIELAKEKSLRMASLAEDVVIAENELKAAVANRRTSVGLDLTLPRYTEDIGETPNEETGSTRYFPIKRLNMGGNLTITQPLPTDGRISLSTGYDLTNDFFNDNRDGSVVTRLQLSQPLNSFWGYNNNKSAIKRARLAYERSSKSLKRSELDLIYNVSRAFYNLLSQQKSTEISKMDYDRQTEAYELSKNKYEAGLIREVDALQMEVDLVDAQNSYEMAILSESSLLYSFKEVLGIDLHDNVTLKSELNYEQVSIDSDKAVSLALENRLEVRESEITIELQKLTLKQNKAQRLPTASLNASIQQRGVSKTPLGDGFNSNWSNTFTDFRDRPVNYSVGFTVSVPIFDWGGNKARVRIAESQLRKNVIAKEETERSIEIEVRDLVAGITSNLKRLQVLEKNVEVAERTFDINLKRFSDGDIDSQALALARARLNTAYNSHLRAYINYQMSLADLMRKTFYDFEKNQAIR